VADKLSLRGGRATKGTDRGAEAKDATESAEEQEGEEAPMRFMETRR